MSALRPLVIGSRGSKLALWQSHWVKAHLEGAVPGLEVVVEIIRTTGDENLGKPLPEIGGKGLFTRELEESLLAGKTDIAVHSLKDLPTVLPDGLGIVAVTKREDPRDALILSNHLRDKASRVGELPERARVGTSSLRRASQLLHLRPDIQIIDIRGNVDTRLRKLESGDYDAIVLAVAGLSRLGFAARIDAVIETDEVLPAVGQGALGIEAREGDKRVRELLASLEDCPTRWATEAERALLRALGGGCAVPIAAHARIGDESREERLVLDAVVADVNGERLIRHQIAGATDAGAQLGKSLAETMLALGAREILGGLRSGN